jgi:hypothetical protein
LQAARVRLEDADVRRLRAEHDVERLAQTERLELGFGGVVRQDAEPEAARLARIEEIGEPRPHEAGQKRQGLLLHPAGDAFRNEVAIDARLFACHSDLRLGQIGRRRNIA